MLEEARKRSENRDEGCIGGVKTENMDQAAASESGLIQMRMSGGKA